MAPYIFIVPGIYEGPGAFEPLVKALNQKGCQNIFTTKLVSTGTTGHDRPAVNMDSDIEHIGKDLSRVVEEAGSNGVVAVCHSAGGFLGGGAIKGLSAPARKEAGKQGGVVKFVFLTAAVLPEGTKHSDAPWMTYDEAAGTQTCVDMRNTFFNDFSDEEAETWIAKMEHQPSKWGTSISYCGWREVPSTYIIATLDKAIPANLQEILAQGAGSKILRVEAGHMAQLSKTDEVASIIATEVESAVV